MSTASIILASIEKVASLDAANFPSGVLPKVYLDSAPLVDGGTQVYPPYVILKDQGQVPSYWDLERSTAEVCDFVFEVYYPLLGDVDTAVQAIKLNGGTRDAALGFDFGSLDALALPRSSYQVLRTRETRSLAGYAKDGSRVHMCHLEYKVTVKEAVS